MKVSQEPILITQKWRWNFYLCHGSVTPCCNRTTSNHVATAQTLPCGSVLHQNKKH